MAKARRRPCIVGIEEETMLRQITGNAMSTKDEACGLWAYLKIQLEYVQRVWAADNPGVSLVAVTGLMQALIDELEPPVPSRPARIKLHAET